jgi:uncharacterized protein YegL
MSDTEYPVFDEEEFEFSGSLFEDVEFIDNPEPRCPCVLLVDTSSSMIGPAIQAINKGIRHFRKELLKDDLAAKRVEVAVVAFGPTRIESNFENPEDFNPPEMQAGGEATMGEAIELAVQLVTDRKETYKEAGVQYYRPWVILISDGRPCDDWESSAELIRGLENDGSLAFWTIGTNSADMDLLSLLSIRDPFRLEGLCFRDLFAWLSQSLQAVSYSRVGEEVELPSMANWVSKY